MAKLAGVPDIVINRAKEICEQLEQADLSNITRNLEIGSGKKAKKKKPDELDMAQISLFDTVKDDDIIEEIREMNLGNLTPIDALNKLYELQNKIKNRW